MDYLSLCAWVYLHIDMLQSKPQLRHYITQGILSDLRTKITRYQYSTSDANKIFDTFSKR